MKPKRPEFFTILTLFLLLLHSAQGQRGFIQYNYAKNEFRLQNVAPPVTSPKSSKPAVWGNYFWEFGDGHYSFDSVAVHNFPRPDLYEVKVFLTPHYSFSKPVSFSKKFSVNQPQGAPPVYSLGNRWVSMESTGGDYLVPGHEMQFVIHYQAPPGQRIEDGYVLLFFNNKKENGTFKIKFDPMLFREERLYYGEEALGDDFFSLPQEGLPAAGLAAAKELFNEHEDLRIFKVGALKPGQEQRLFCTIATDQRLEDHQDKDRELTMTALWLPRGSLFDEDKNRFVHKMEVLEVHDPNRIKVLKNTAYYLPNRRTRLNYKVDFQNKAKGVVEDVVVYVPLSKELNIKTIQIQEEYLDPIVPECPEGEASEAAACYQVETRESTDQDSLVFTFQNIALEGTKATGFFQNKKSTKGRLAFSVENRQKRVTNTKMRAFIFFKGSQEIIKTQITTTRWRQRSFNLSLGQNVGQQAANYANTANNFGQQFNIGLSVQDAPLGRGLLFGLQANATAFHFTRQDVTEIAPQALLPNGGIWSRSEIIDLRLLEAKAFAGFQLNRFLRMYGGLGYSVPLKAELTLEAFAANTPESEPIFYDRSSTDLGVLAAKDPLSIFEQEIDAKQSTGVHAFIGVEMGLPNDLALGLSHERRHFPQSYNQACSHIRSWRVYLKGKLFAFR